MRRLARSGDVGVGGRLQRKGGASRDAHDVVDPDIRQATHAECGAVAVLPRLAVLAYDDGIDYRT